MECSTVVSIALQTDTVLTSSLYMSKALPTSKYSVPILISGLDVASIVQQVGVRFARQLVKNHTDALVRFLTSCLTAVRSNDLVRPKSRLRTAGF